MVTEKKALKMKMSVVKISKCFKNYGHKRKILFATFGPFCPLT